MSGLDIASMERFISERYDAKDDDLAGASNFPLAAWMTNDTFMLDSIDGRHIRRSSRPAPSTRSRGPTQDSQRVPPAWMGNPTCHSSRIVTTIVSLSMISAGQIVSHAVHRSLPDHMQILHLIIEIDPQVDTSSIKKTSLNFSLSTHSAGRRTATLGILVKARSGYPQLGVSPAGGPARQYAHQTASLPRCTQGHEQMCTAIASR